jgi:hypothetical protein
MTRSITLIAGLLALWLFSLGTAPSTMANRLTSGNNAWTLPIGAHVARECRCRRLLPALRLQHGSTGQLRTQVTLIFR